MVRPWQKLAETARKVFEHYNFEVWTVKFRNPTTEKESEFVLHGQKNKTGAAVLAVTVNLNVVAIREYMQGADMIIRLLPGGAAAFEGEAPEETARRELMEETGYQAEELIPLGYCFLEPRNS